MIQFAKGIWAATLSLGVLGGLGNTASAALIPVFSTGTTSTGALATPGTPDANYTLIASPAGAGTTATVGTNLPSVWVGNTATSQWISPNANSSITQPGGLYDYQTKFSLAGLNAATAAISGQIAADDNVTILLNGIATPNLSTGFSSFANFSLNSGFVAGTNTLDFIVTNATITTFDPTGLQVNITSATATASAAVPEPASIVLLGLGGIAVAGLARRRRAAA